MDNSEILQTQTAVDRARAQSNVGIRRATAELRRLQTDRYLGAELPDAEGLVSHKDVARVRKRLARTTILLTAQQPNHRYAEAIAAHGASLSRLARGYEADPDRRSDLLQEIHIALWRSFAAFDGRCSLRTWVYRIAHNVAASHIVRNRRASARLVDLDALETEPGFIDAEAQADSRHSAARLLELIHKLAPVDRQTILLYLEGERAESIAEVTGLSAVNVATKIHRIGKLLSRQFQEGEPHAGQRG